MTYSNQELKNALQREDAPEGFTERVLARVAQRNSPQAKPARDNSWLSLFTQPFVRWATAAAICAVMIVGGLHYRQVQLKAERERAQGEAAKQQLVLALRIAGSKLQLAKAKVNEMNTNETQHRQVKE
jgi:hypothetical protein